MGKKSEFEDAARWVARTVADTATVAVGLGVLGFNRFQVLRRDLESRLNPAKGGPPNGSGEKAGPAPE